MDRKYPMSYRQEGRRFVLYNARASFRIPGRRAREREISQQVDVRDNYKLLIK